MAGILHEVSPADPLTFVAVAVALLTIAALASFLPACHATKVDPMEALRRVVFEPSTIIMKTIAIALGTLCVLGFAACGKKTKPTAEKSSGHVHVAPHGGTLVEIGEHAYNLELVRDNAAGKLTAYVLDGHAENFVRIKSPTIELIAMPGGTYTPVSLKAVANPSTGETVGDTCQFEAQADWLKSAGDFSGIFTVEIHGTKFAQVEYHLPKESPARGTTK